MEKQRLLITIDGPAGAGKSAVARRLAGRLGVDFLDTGAMYRGVAATAIERGVDPGDAAGVATLVEALDVRFDWTADPPRLRVDGVDLVQRLRDPDVTGVVSTIAANGDVRAMLVAAQQRIGREHPRLVTEGRDQGSVVFPDATAKFYLDASPEVRAVRRSRQLREAGQSPDEKVILEQIIARDRRDEGRADGPLICPVDADRIDSSDMTLDEVLDCLTERVEVRRAGGGDDV